MQRLRWSRVLFIVGLLGMLIGAVDPLEGSVVILAGSGVAALGAMVGHTSRRRLIYSAFGLIAAGVMALFALSAVGGLGGDTGRSVWLGVVILPYPIGWIIGMTATILALREVFRRPVPPVGTA
jgi:hypothetical protein